MLRTVFSLVGWTIEVGVGHWVDGKFRDGALFNFFLSLLLDLSFKPLCVVKFSQKIIRAYQRCSNAIERKGEEDSGARGFS